MAAFFNLQSIEIGHRPSLKRGKGRHFPATKSLSSSEEPQQTGCGSDSGSGNRLRPIRVRPICSALEFRSDSK
jgi:hypothetical protein